MYVCPHNSSGITEPIFNQIMHVPSKLPWHPESEIFNGSKHFCKRYLHFLTRVTHTISCISKNFRNIVTY